MPSKPRPGALNGLRLPVPCGACLRRCTSGCHDYPAARLFWIEPSPDCRTIVIVPLDCRSVTGCRKRRTTDGCPGAGPVAARAPYCGLLAVHCRETRQPAWQRTGTDRTRRIQALDGTVQWRILSLSITARSPAVKITARTVMVLAHRAIRRVHGGKKWWWSLARVWHRTVW